MSMKVAQLTTTLEGGAGVAALRLSSALNEVGVTSKVVSQRGFKGTTSIRSKLTTVIQRNFLQSTNNLMTTFSQTTIEKSNVQIFDVLHFHAFYNLVRSQDIEIISGEKPIFLSLHDQRFLTGGCHYSGLCKAYEASCKTCPQAGRAFWQSVQREKEYINHLLNSPRVNIITPSNWLAEMAAKIVTSKTKIHIVRNPIPDESKSERPLLRAKYQIHPTKFVIGFVSVNLNNPLKGLKDLENAIRLLPTSLLESIHVLLVGKSNINLSCGVESKSVIVDPPENMRLKLYQLMDVLAVPSRQDNSPNVIGEALINGTRVLGSKVGGIPEILHEFGCPVVDTTNAEVFAKSIIEEMSIKYNRLELSEKAIKSFGYHEIGNKIKKLYEESL